jgi:4-hydroxy-3-methylbut-2-enyl diphosphate reductase
VDRAVDALKVALKRHCPPVYDTEGVPEGAVTTFAVHGVPSAVRRAAAQGKLKVVDAARSPASKVRNEVSRFARRDIEVSLTGHKGHEEIEGACGEAPDCIHVIDGVDAVKSVVVQAKSGVARQSQTTLGIDETLANARKLRERFPLLQDPPTDVICYATQNRQTAVKAPAAQRDVLIVVGSHNSSNSIRLGEAARKAGVTAVDRVDHAGEADVSWLSEATTVGVTSGASVPEPLVRNVLAASRESGPGEVQHARTAEETVAFARPREPESDEVRQR